MVDGNGNLQELVRDADEEDWMTRMRMRTTTKMIVVVILCNRDPGKGLTARLLFHMIM
jgi:hypothetical protein